ncbi:MAG TPA: prepilin-type N-terminal cleavage/methylation domain-containing protein [Syntrophales bacterium]|nr:prepilin-type N-terminal cleavage/methylation domain-containing protein [Syntrophales bacterium]
MNEKGFSLVELAIGLVIIGLILAGIVKGQELIFNAKMKSMYNAQKEVAAAAYTRYNRYQEYLGDDNTVTTIWPGTFNGNGDGLIAGGIIGIGAAPGAMFTCTAATDSESYALWQRLRLAGLISGTDTIGAARLNPTQAYGGTIGVANVAVNDIMINWIPNDRKP